MFVVEHFLTQEGAVPPGRAIALVLTQGACEVRSCKIGFPQIGKGSPTLIIGPSIVVSLPFLLDYEGAGVDFGVAAG